MLVSGETCGYRKTVVHFRRYGNCPAKIIHCESKIQSVSGYAYAVLAVGWMIWLSGSDSARACFGRTATSGCDHEARQSHAADVAGRSRANRGSPGSTVAQRVSASLPSEAESSG